MHKLIASIVSMILVAGIVLGVVAVVRRDNNSGNGGKGLVSTSKSVTEICAPTDYKEVCKKSLSSVKNADDPKEYLQAAILATIDAAKKAFNLSDDLIVKANNTKDPEMKMSLEDCKDLLQDAVAELQASFSSVGESQLNSMDNRVAELQNWFSAVISYQETCLDQFGDDEQSSKATMQNGILDARQLTSNALAIVSALADILNSLGLEFNFPNNNARKLLSIDDDGYPDWLSPRNRRILAAENMNGVVKPNAIVAQDGSAQFNTIGEALAMCPKKSNGPYVIYVKAGIYKEYVTVDKKQLNVFIYGDGPSKTIITGNKSNRTGYKTMRTATFEALGEGFTAKSIGIENTAGPEGHQAVALRVQSDRSTFIDCKIDGYQDTLYVQTHRQFYNNCTISGTIDFIFGDASAVIQNSLIVVRRPMNNQQNTVTAQGRVERHETTGLIIKKCKIIAEDKLEPDKQKFPSFLGRPWKPYSRAIIIESEIGDVIQPAGWMPWVGDLYLDTLHFAEYGNTGPGANAANRVKWKGFQVLNNKNDVVQYDAAQFLQIDRWNKTATAVNAWRDPDSD